MGVLGGSDRGKDKEREGLIEKEMEGVRREKGTEIMVKEGEREEERVKVSLKEAERWGGGGGERKNEERERDEERDGEGVLEGEGGRERDGGSEGGREGRLVD